MKSSLCAARELAGAIHAQPDGDVSRQDDDRIFSDDICLPQKTDRRWFEVPILSSLGGVREVFGSQTFAADMLFNGATEQRFRARWRKSMSSIQRLRWFEVKQSFLLHFNDENSTPEASR